MNNKKSDEFSVEEEEEKVNEQRSSIVNVVMTAKCCKTFQFEQFIHYYPHRMLNCFLPSASLRSKHHIHTVIKYLSYLLKGNSVQSIDTSNIVRSIHDRNRTSQFIFYCTFGFGTSRKKASQIGRNRRASIRSTSSRSYTWMNCILLTVQCARCT